MVTVRTHLPESAAQETTIRADLDIEFAGQSVHYKDVPFEVATQGKEKKLTGTIPAKVSDFKIEPPTLLTMPIKNDIPVKIDMSWRQQ